MKTILCALITLPLGFAVAAPESQVASIQTLQGKAYRQCKIVQRDPDGIVFTHSRGTARVLYNDLPQSTSLQLGYNPRSAAELQRSRELARQEKIDARRLQQKRAEELRHVARLAEIKQASQRPLVIYQQPGGYSFAGPVPAVGFAAPGWNGYGYGYGLGQGGYGHRRPGAGWQYHPHIRGWEGVGIASIGSGSGGIYTPQSGGFIFTNMPQVHYSPTLGYYNPGYYAQPAVPSRGNFGFVPGLMAPNPPAVVPGAGIRGGISLPAGR